MARQWKLLDPDGWKASGRDFANYSRFILPAGVAAVLIAVLGVGWYTQPDRYVRGYEPMQPIPYSHRLHSGVMKIPMLMPLTTVKRVANGAERN